MKNLQWTFARLLHHAFMSGAGYADPDRIKDVDLQRWAVYDPPHTMLEIDQTLEQAAKLVDKVQHVRHTAGDGQPYIKVSFNTVANMHDFHDALIALKKLHTKKE